MRIALVNLNYYGGWSFKDLIYPECKQFLAKKKYTQLKLYFSDKIKSKFKKLIRIEI